MGPVPAVSGASTRGRSSFGVESVGLAHPGARSRTRGGAVPRGWGEPAPPAQSRLPRRTPVVRHYKVKREGAEYVIDVEDPFSCSSLDAVVNYFVSHTKKALVPFLLDEDYEKVLGYVDADKENGENVWTVPSAPDPDPGPAPPAGGPKSLPASSQDKLPPLPPLPPLPSQDDNYVTPIGDAPAADYVNQDVSSLGRQVVPKPKKLAKPPAKPPKPPTVPKPEPKGNNRPLAKKLVGGSPQAVFLATRLGDVTAELQEKLQKRRALEQ